MTRKKKPDKNIILTLSEAAAILRYINEVEADTNITHIATPVFREGLDKLIVAREMINEAFAK